MGKTRQLLTMREIEVEFEQAVLDLSVSAFMIDLLENTSDDRGVSNTVLVMSKAHVVTFLLENVDHVCKCFDMLHESLSKDRRLNSTNCR